MGKKHASQYANFGSLLTFPLQQFLKVYGTDTVAATAVIEFIRE